MTAYVSMPELASKYVHKGGTKMDKDRLISSNNKTTLHDSSHMLD